MTGGVGLNHCIAEPLSRKDIRKISEYIRILDGSANRLYFDIVGFVEKKWPRIDPEFSFNVKSMQEMGDFHGLTYPDRNEINIREDVYERACNDSGRDRLTIAHEFFHLLQHGRENISLARTGNEKIPLYRNPEWQADAFGGELLIPKRLISGMSENQVIEACRVSSKAAKCQMKCG